MSKTRILASGAAVLFLTTAVAAFAVPKGFHPRHASPADLAAAQAGQGSLNRAISTVESLTGGQVLAIHFETNNGSGVYDATISRNGAVSHALMNAATKQVALVDQGQGSARTFDFREKADAELVVRASKVALHDAIANAEQSSRGIAVAARTARSGDGYMVAHDVDTVRGDMVRPVLIDAKTGLVIQNVQAFEGDY